ncbi:MAG: phosphate ABC transporter permease PstA [Nocardioidaceae bacterium]
MSTPVKTDPQRGEASTTDLESQLHQAQLHPSAVRGMAAAALVVVLLLHTVSDLGFGLAVLLSWLLFVVSVYAASRRVEGGRKASDRLASVLVTSSFAVALLPLTTLLWIIVSKGAPAINGTFLNSSMRNVVGEGGGIYHAVFGTLIVTGVAALMSIPIGLLTSIYLVEYGSGKLARNITLLVDVMTGIPSIVAGLFAYALFAIFFGEGIRMGLGGAVALSVLMIPLVVRSCEEMLKLVPVELREASYALGVSKWRTVVKVVLPTALAGIVTGVTIAIARVIGETAPLLIICGYTDSVNLNPLSGRMMTLPVYIYSQFKNPGIPPEVSIERAWGAALVLTVIIMVLNLVARAISYYFSPKTKA